MATKISMAIPDKDLALIDKFSNGNRTAFMVDAALTRARLLQRQAIDEDIARSLATNDFADLVAELDGLSADGLDGLDELSVTSKVE